MVFAWHPRGRWPRDDSWQVCPFSLCIHSALSIKRWDCCALQWILRCLWLRMQNMWCSEACESRPQSVRTFSSSALNPWANTCEIQIILCTGMSACVYVRERETERKNVWENQENKTSEKEKNKSKNQKCHSQEESKETWQLNVTQYPDEILEQKRTRAIN